jgi:hypothetical protein
MKSQQTLGKKIGSFRIAAPMAVAVLSVCFSAAGQTINVEIDYMTNSVHSHRPQQSEINAVVQMFACHGITLNVVVDDPINEIPILHCNNPGVDDFFTCDTATSFKRLKDAYCDHPTWHYCIFAHDYDDGDGTGSSGISEINGDDFVVSLGSFTGDIGTSWDRASTFAHEFGHNLGLTHAGSQNEGDVGKRKPNFASIMSYCYQLRGVKQQMNCLGIVNACNLFKNLDYSSGRMPALDENALSESRGAGIHRVDWNCNGVEDPDTVAQDISEQRGHWCGATGTRNSILDYDDWAEVMAGLTLRRKLGNRFNVVRPIRITRCITADEYQKQRQSMVSLSFKDPSLCPDDQPSVVNEPNVTALMIWVDSAEASEGDGRGDSPYRTVKRALQDVPSGSYLYLQPGTYTNNGSLVIADHVYLAGPGHAVIDP